MRTVNYSEARQNLADVLESAVTGVPVTITRRGHKSAVIISAEEFERYQAARMDDEFAAIMAVHGDGDSLRCTCWRFLAVIYLMMVISVRHCLSPCFF